MLHSGVGRQDRMSTATTIVRESLRSLMRSRESWVRFFRPLVFSFLRLESGNNAELCGGFRQRREVFCTNIFFYSQEVIICDDSGGGFRLLLEQNEQSAIWPKRAQAGVSFAGGAGQYPPMLDRASANKTRGREWLLSWLSNSNCDNSVAVALATATTWWFDTRW